MDELEAFMANMEEGEEDPVRVVTYTTEGDPILLELTCDGERSEATFDSTRDAYGTGSVETTTCDSIVVNETTEFTEYVLEGCETANFDTTVFVQ
ncbi:hypothetical protein B0X71_05680 [Planococcus lenghuensis]|uniref:DUF4362 domain-containing protein n=1 Tax=Planococcus lenghuensis TaxID=2213202 RepID=A0A1Q2KXV2_9BACL|nr:hypothetical protein B0X71_05680 [Planococcus lenghuensis]